MGTINLNKRVTSIEVGENKIVINFEREWIPKEGEYFFVKSNWGRGYLGISIFGKT